MTHTNSCIHMFSSDRKEIKIGALTGLAIRAYRICSLEFLDKELEYLRESFRRLGYPKYWWEQAHIKARKDYFGEKERKEKEHLVGKKIITVQDNNSITPINRKLDNFKLTGSYKNIIRNKIVRNKKSVEGGEIRGGYMWQRV